MLIPTVSEFTQNSVLLKFSVVIVKFHFQNGPIVKLASYNPTDFLLVTCDYEQIKPFELLFFMTLQNA
jgi:hypothetical protein